MASDNVKRYFSRAWEGEIIIDDSPSSDNLDALHIILAIATGYLTITCFNRFRVHYTNKILLRSFPYCATKERGSIKLWGVTPDLMATGMMTVCVAMLWSPDYFRLAYLLLVLGSIVYGFGSVALLWTFETMLLLSHKIGKWSGWVPYDEPWKGLEMQSRVEDSSAQDRCPSLGSPYDPLWRPSRKTSTARIAPLRYMRDKIFPAAQTGVHIINDDPREDPSISTMYQSLTAKDQYKAKSFEEWRLEHYRDKERYQAEQSPGMDQSLFGRSLSFLSDSFSGFSSVASRDTFGRTTIGHGSLRIDGFEECESPQKMSDFLTRMPLLTGTPLLTSTSRRVYN